MLECPCPGQTVGGGVVLSYSSGLVQFICVLLEAPNQEVITYSSYLQQAWLDMGDEMVVPATPCISIANKFYYVMYSCDVTLFRNTL